jgi:hypothetical protein
MADGFGKAGTLPERLRASLALVRKRQAPDQRADADRPSRTVHAPVLPQSISALEHDPSDHTSEGMLFRIIP